MKKGIICAVLALMVVLSMAGVAAADSTPGSGNGDQSVAVTHNVIGTYTWTIPDAMVFEGETLSFTKDVTIKNMIIASDEKVVITVPGTILNGKQTRKLLLQNAEGTAAETDAASNLKKQIVYTIVGSPGLSCDTTKDITTVLSAAAGDTEAITPTGKTTTLTVATSTDAIAAAKYAGTYKDTITFTAATEKIIN